MLPDREILSVAELTKADRICPEAAGIVAANQASPIAVGVIALSEEVSGAVKPGNRATVVVRAVKARPHEVEVEVAEASPAAEVGALAAAVVVAAADAGN